MATKGKKVRVAAIADVHCTRTSQGQLAPLFAEMAAAGDVITICGDLTDYGLPEEAQALVKELSEIKVPVVAVLGNHDHESGRADEVQSILCDAGITVLDGESIEIEGVGFAGAKGFAGGFGQRALPMWGEAICKQFVQEAVNEALKLETALARLSTPHRIALLHYSPIEATVANEPTEIFAWMGSSRLEEPVDRYPVMAVFHGHAHRGGPEGKTHGNVPVYNVSMPLLKELGRPFKVMEVAVGATNAKAPAVAA